MLIETQNKTAKETSLIETINIISKENGTLKEQIEALKSEQLLAATIENTAIVVSSNLLPPTLWLFEKMNRIIRATFETSFLRLVV